MESARRAAALTFDNRTKWKMSCQHQWTRLFSCVRSYTLSATRYYLSLRPRRRSRRPSPFPRACSPGTHTCGGAGAQVRPPCVLCPVPDDEGLREPCIVPSFLARLEAARWVDMRVPAYTACWVGLGCADGLLALDSAATYTIQLGERMGSGGRRWGGWRR